MVFSRRRFLESIAAAAMLPAGAVQAETEPFRVAEDESRDVPYKFRRRETDFQTSEPAGTIVVDSHQRLLYLVYGNGKALRYGVAVSKRSMAWTGEATIKRMAKWPVWVPAPYHLQHMPSLAKYKDGMPGGLDNPMGARAMYLYQGEVDTINRIHGGMKAQGFEKAVTAGCIGMLNSDIIHLYSQVQLGTRVVVF
jgi:lipoprotein-anchoring transpeptidase ErfK/SrfK